MPHEEELKRQLLAKFAYLEGKITVVRPRRISLVVELGNFGEVFDYVVKQLGWSHLCTITGLDEGETLGFIYHLTKEPGMVINIKTSVDKKNPVLKTVISYFPGAEVYERELIDLFGAKVEGLPEGNRYPLTDDWPKDQFPLRKDWKPVPAQQEKEKNNA
jgi:Ni,Fe-hydrogenase III component G